MVRTKLRTSAGFSLPNLLNNYQQHSYEGPPPKQATQVPFKRRPGHLALSGDEGQNTQIPSVVGRWFFLTAEARDQRAREERQRQAQLFRSPVASFWQADWQGDYSLRTTSPSGAVASSGNHEDE